MNNHEHLDPPRDEDASKDGKVKKRRRQMQFKSELGEQQRRRLYYRSTGQLGPGTY